MKPFQLIRTNPALTGNVKLVINENYDLFLESFDSTRNLKQSRYKHYEITKDQYWKEVLTRFFNKTDSTDVFAVKNNDDIYNTLTTYKNQYDDIYFSGCKIVDDKSYNETYEYSAPLHIKNELPSNFYIFAIDNMVSSDFSDFKSNMNLVKTFDLGINTNLGTFLNNIISDNTKPTHPLVIDTTYGLSYINGVNLNTSGYINSYFDNNFAHENLPIFRMEEYVTSLYQKNNTIYPDIINMKFLFTDIPSTDTSVKEYNISRYAGFYANKKLIDTITPYKLLPVKGNIIYDISIKSFVDNGKPAKPFDVVWNDNSKYYVYIDSEYFQVVRNNELYTIVDDNRFTSNILNNMFVTDNNAIIIKNNIITGINPNLTFDDKSVYTIEILGTEYTFTGSEIKSYNRIDVDEFKIDITNNNTTTTTLNNDLVEFKIYRLCFLDIKDFDFDRVSTDQAKFEYDKNHEIIVNEEPKFYAKNHIMSNINVYTLVGNKYMRLPRVDANNIPLYLQDNLGVVDYTQYDLYTHDKDGNFMLYHDGVNFFDYNLKPIALKQEYIEENGYSYIATDSNNVQYTITFNDKKSIYQTANWGVDGKDIISTSPNNIPSIPVTSPYSSDTYIPASSEYVTSGESFELQNNNLSKLYDKNQSVVKWGATGSIDIHNYPYRLNYSSDFPIYNSVIPFTNDISIYSRKDMCFDYFYRFNNNQNYAYSFSSLHLPINSFDKFGYDFNEMFISSNINDKGKYNHYSYSTFTSKNKSSRAETIFRNLKLSVDNKYNEYKFSIIFANDTYSEDLKHGVNFIIDESNKNIVMHLYINSSNIITLNNNIDISICDIKYWYDDIYTKDDINNTTQNYIDTGFKVNGVYINIRPQDFALPNIINKLINNEYIAYDKTSKSKMDFSIEVSYPDAIKLKKPFVTTVLDIDGIDVTNTYENMNINGTVTNLDLFKNDFIALSLEQKDTRNIWELDESDITIYRHSFGYSPIFKNIELFDSSINNNTVFDTDLYNFGMTSEMYLSKTNHYGTILKIDDIDTNKSMYPKIDEYGLFVTRKNIFISNADTSTFVMNRKYTKDLSNTPASGNAGYFNKSVIRIPDSTILSNENNIIPQLDYAGYIGNNDTINNYEFIIPPGITDYYFTVKVLKYKQYSFKFNDTLDIYGMDIQNVDANKIEKSTGKFFFGYLIKYIYDTPEENEELTIDLNYKLKLVNPTGGKINVYMGYHGGNNEVFNIPNNILYYTFSVKLLKNKKYSFKFNDTLDVYGMFINNMDVSKIEKSTSTSFNGYYIRYIQDDIYDDVTIDINYTLKLVNPTGGIINVFLSSYNDIPPTENIFYLGQENNLYVESGDIYLDKTDISTSPYLYQSYDSNHNSLYSKTENITPYIFTDITKYNAYTKTEPGRYGETPYADTTYPIPNTWNGNIYFDILNDKLGNECGNNLKAKIDAGAYGGYNGITDNVTKYDLSTIYHFLEYGSQDYDKNNIDPGDYRTYRVGYVTGLTYFYLLSGMNVTSSNITNTYKTFTLTTKKYEDIPTQYLLGNEFVNNTLQTDYVYDEIDTEHYMLNSVDILWDAFYNDKTLSFNIQTVDGTKNVDVDINLYMIDNVTKKTISEITTELSNELIGKYTVSSQPTIIDSIYKELSLNTNGGSYGGSNNIPRYTFTVKSLNPYYTENFIITLNTITDFRLDKIINVAPTISYNEVAKKTELIENRITGRTNDLTVEFFVKTDSFNKKFETIFYKGNDTSDDISYFIGRDDISNRLLFRTVHENFYNSTEDNINNYSLGKKSYTTHDLYSSNFINDGKYHHVACVVDYLNRTKTIYIDGQKDNSVTDYLNNEIPDISTRLACFIANTPRFVGSDIIHINIKNIYTLAYAILDIDNTTMDVNTKQYAEYWKNTILGNADFAYIDLDFMKTTWKITYDKAFKIFNDNFQSLNYSLKTVNQDLYIGNSPVSYMSDFVGCLDQIRVWNYARTSDDIYRNYRYDLENTYDSYDKALVVNINFNTDNIVSDTAVTPKNVMSWFISKNKKVFKTTNEYTSNTYDSTESVFMKYDFIKEKHSNEDIVFDNVSLIISEANIIGTRDEKANIPDVIDSTKITNYKSYYSNNNNLSTNISSVPNIVDSHLIYKL